MAIEDGTQIYFGSAVKALPDGKVGGYLIQFGGPDTADCDGEYFTAETDLDTEFPAKASVYYNHGMDPELGLRRVGRGEMKADAVGVWIEAQLDLADQYQAAIYQLARAGKLGWSSGAVSHLTDPPRHQRGGAIKQWPLKEASLTPHPADSRNAAIALKGWEPPTFQTLLGGEEPLSAAGHAAQVVKTCADYAERLESRLEARIKAGRVLSAANRGEIEGVLASFEPVLARLRTLLERAHVEPIPEKPERVSLPAPESSAVSATYADSRSDAGRLIDDAFSAMLRTDRERTLWLPGNSDGN